MRLDSFLVPALALAACSAGQLQPFDPGVSPGTVTFSLLLPSSRSFCDSTHVCAAAPVHVSFTTTSGEGISRGGGNGFCAPTECSSECRPGPCLTIACGGPVTGVAVTGVGMTWDGSYAESSTCGNSIACENRRFVPPGRYVVWMCATPGDLVPTESGPPSCAPTGPQECVQVPFDIPGPPVEASLPGVIDIDPPPPPI